MTTLTRPQRELLRKLADDGVRAESTWGGGDLRGPNDEWLGRVFTPTINALHRLGYVDREVTQIRPLSFKTTHTINAAGREALAKDRR